MLVDFDLCIGCRACQVACKQWNQNEAEVTENYGTYENPKDLSAQTWTKIKFIEEGKNPDVKFLFRRVMCQHCTEAACEQVCPAKAISHEQGVAVVIDQDKCTGCKYCISACPFSVPRYDAATKWISARDVSIASRLVHSAYLAMTRLRIPARNARCVSTASPTG